MKAIVDTYYDEICWVVVVPDDFDLESDRKAFFKAESDAGKIRLRKDGWPIAKQSENAFDRHAGSMESRFGKATWEHA